MQSAKEKLHKLYRLYEKPMYHIAYAVLHHTQQTEEAVSEAFYRSFAILQSVSSERMRKKQIVVLHGTNESCRFLTKRPPVPQSSKKNRNISRQFWQKCWKFLVKPTGRSCCCVVSRNFPFGRLPNGAALRKQQHVSVLNVPEKP